MNVGSLFSGIGGIDLGLERAGCRVVFQCESDPWRRSVLAERFPGVPCYDDVRGVGGDLHRQRLLGRKGLVTADTVGGGQAEHGSVDVLCGGFPCQDLSVAGRRAGLIQGERSSLFFEFARVADELVRPGGYVLVENVPGLLSSNGGRDFAVVLAALAELGFHDLAWRVLDSRYFGVPQRRRRVFVLGRRARGQCCAEVLLEPEGGGGDFAAGGEARPDVAVASLSGLGSGGPDDNDGQANRVIASALVKRYGKGTDSDATDAAVRRLTPREAERLQGFPDDWTLIDPKTPDSRRYAALGDAVTVPVAHWIGRRLVTRPSPEKQENP